MAARLDDVTLNVPVLAATATACAPFGSNATEPLDPALTEPEKITLLAVMAICEPLVEIEVDTALVTLPVPFVVMVMLFVAVTLALRAIVPLEPNDVWRNTSLPDTVLEVVILPAAISASCPFVDATVPEVPMLPAVVVMVKLPPTEDVPRTTEVEVCTSAVPVPVLTERTGALVKMGVPLEPILPVSVVRLTVPEVRVTKPERVIVPKLMALTLIVPLVPVDTLLLIATVSLVPVVPRLTVVVPLMVIAPPIVKVPEALTLIVPVVPLIVPSVTVPTELATVVIVSDLAPIVIVCPDEVNDVRFCRNSRL